MPATDFIIVTALEEERTSILRLLPDAKQLPPSSQDPRVYFAARVPLSRSQPLNSHYNVVLVSLIDMGRVQASATISDAIRAWSPSFVLLVGIAGGVYTQGVQLGDVLIADQIVDYSLQKQTSTSNSHRWRVYPVDVALLEAAKNSDIGDWQSFIRAPRPRLGTPERRIGTVASGDRVIADDSFLQELLNTWPKLLGVEMEASGIATICHQSKNKPGFFMVRGVSDHADAKKNLTATARWRIYACDAAASYALALIRSGPVIPSETRPKLPGRRRLDLIRDLQAESKSSVPENTDP